MTETIVVKLALSDDEYQQVLAIRKEVFVKEQRVPESIEIDEFETTSDHFLVLVNNQPAACGRLRLKGQYAKFERIATLKQFRGSGVGSKLMAFMMSHARQKYSNALPYMHSQVEAVPFYQKLGWSAEGEIFYEANIPHQVMVFKN
jgi:predicted GNAT family N-acyltransferase